ncbi:hypothetical protein [Helicobacter sp. L8]|uniref:hypothetical protein n=1 Tax=Helicobacter sp. L8 TaxID=2316078 RepID=UPI0013CDF08B|nr:hypothetical protein [Helicobacter sp. L8]
MPAIQMLGVLKRPAKHIKHIEKERTKVKKVILLDKTQAQEFEEAKKLFPKEMQALIWRISWACSLAKWAKRTLGLK